MITWQRKPTRIMLIVLLLVALAVVGRIWLLPKALLIVADGNLSQATNQVDAALAGIAELDNTTWEGSDFCSSSTINQQPFYYTLGITQKQPSSLLGRVGVNCITKTKEDTYVFDQAARAKLNTRVSTIEDTLKNEGWIGGGWIKSFAYNATSWPNYPAGGGNYWKHTLGGMCWFDFTAEYDNSDDHTVMVTYVWCDQGHESYTF